MQTIAIVNEKGGSGKTTTAVNLSAALGELGRKVLLVDLDGQAASSRWLGVEEDVSFADALWRGEELRPIPDVIPGVSLAPGSGKLDSVAHDLRPTQGGQLHKLLLQVEGFEFAIIDCPPSLGNRLIGNALLAATHAIVPVETSILAMDGLKILLTTLDDVRDGFGHEIDLTGVLACRYDARTRLSRFILAELNRALPGKVFKTVIRENVRLRECPASGQSILTFAPTSHGAEDYMSLARELLGMDASQADDAATNQSAKADLTEEEHIAAGEVRQRAEEVLNQLTAKSAVPPPGPPPPDESHREETGVPAEPDAAAPAEPEKDQETSDQAQPDEPGSAAPTVPESLRPVQSLYETPPPVEPPAPITGEPPGGEQPGETPPDEVALVGPSEPSQEGGQSDEIALPPMQATPSIEPVPEAPPAGTDYPAEEPTDEETPALPAQVEEHRTWDGPLDSEAPVTDEADRQDDQTCEAAPAEEEPTAEETSDEHEDYPALQAMLKRMTEADHLDEVKV